VAAIGHLFATGRLDVQRVISLAGPCVHKPRLLRTRLGAQHAALTQRRTGARRGARDFRLGARWPHGRGRCTVIWAATTTRSACVAEAQQREMFGWIMPGSDKFSIWGVVLGAISNGKGLALNTTTNGGARAMVPIGSFERVMPLDLMPTFLLRALLMKNDERAEKLGCLELDEDDLALCTFVCPGKAEYGPLLRQALARIEKEAA
jgi:Na+-transporting NADH:ubiquinone oxidoreductase subunit A